MDDNTEKKNRVFKKTAVIKAGLFVQGLAYSCWISTNLVSKICITWINILYVKLKDLFPFPAQEMVRKNMAQEFVQYATTRIILECIQNYLFSVLRQRLHSVKSGLTISTTTLGSR